MENIRITLNRLKFLNKKYQNNDGDIFTIIEYNSNNNLTIQFIDGIIVKNISLGNITKGKTRHPNYKNKTTYLKIGYIGIGNFNSNNSKIYYNIWYFMLKRCYDETFKIKNPSYSECIVDEKWHNFQNFAKWCQINYKNNFVLDKDILIKGNKIYSEETCCFVPQQINNLFLKNETKRGKYPIGVYYSKSMQKYNPQINICGIQKSLGFYNVLETAFEVYKNAKEKLILDIANNWKIFISEKVYDAMCNYKVEITD